MRHSSRRRGISLVLPISFVWLFAACLIVCATHVEGESVHSESSLLTAEETDCCSMTSSPAVLAERFGFSIAPQKVLDPSFISPLRTGGDGPFVSLPVPFSSSSPPLELLGTLRI